MFENQFYPTPKHLAQKAWSKFQNKYISRLLEPSAGDGDLLSFTVNCGFGGSSNLSFLRSSKDVDCVEIDVLKHPLLASKGYNVIGVDFNDFVGASLYSHILMNPPFAEGAKHVLKAWNILFDGELVAIVNAETIKNPFSKERQLLTTLIDQYGSVEFVSDSFTTPDTKRKTTVEVAIVYLKKESDFNADHLLSGLSEDTKPSSLASEIEEINEIAIPKNEVETSVYLFNIAVNAMKDSVFSSVKSDHYAFLLGDLFGESSTTKPSKKQLLNQARTLIQDKYDDLKGRAWARILRSTDVSSRLSAKGQKLLESKFETVKKLEFTESNVYSFLIGLINSQQEINLEMAFDVFDSITKYHSENTVWYKGWKSNDKHISSARKIKTSRFIIPNHRASWFSPSWNTIRYLSDIDKVFAMLDGKQVVKNKKGDQSEEVSLAELFDTKESFQRLKSGERLSSSYFDVRYYPLAGTIHFFPKRKDLVDRLNRLVGKHRQWLPDESEVATDGFWKAYDKAESLGKEVAQALKDRNLPERGIVYTLDQPHHSQEKESIICSINEAIDSILTAKGFNVDTLLLTDNAKHQALLMHGNGHV